jgi:hypothetical protein
VTDGGERRFEWNLRPSREQPGQADAAAEQEPPARPESDDTSPATEGVEPPPTEPMLADPFEPELLTPASPAPTRAADPDDAMPPTEAMQQPIFTGDTALPFVPGEPGGYAPPPPPWGTPAIDASLTGSAGVFAAQPLTGPTPVDEGGPASGLDALFSTGQFRTYDDAPLLQQLAPTRAEPATSPRASAARSGWGAPQRVLIGVAVGLVTALVLVGLFIVGTRSSDALLGAPLTAATSTPDPAPSTPAPAPTAVAPVAPGEWEWDELQGTECVSPFEDAWQQSYTVVDCEEDHAAQLLVRGQFEEDETAAYPGLDELTSRTDSLCASRKVLDYDLAREYADLQVSASFAGDDSEWAAGDHDYFCFVSRSSAAPIAGSVAAMATSGSSPAP